jgi:hypothetical protein
MPSAGGTLAYGFHIGVLTCMMKNSCVVLENTFWGGQYLKIYIAVSSCQHEPLLQASNQEP